MSLFRPPSETSHYYREASTAMARDGTPSAWQRGKLSSCIPLGSPAKSRCLTGAALEVSPVTLRCPFRSYCSQERGCGRLLRRDDAARGRIPGIPAYSILQSEIGAVDRWLETVAAKS